MVLSELDAAENAGISAAKLLAALTIPYHIGPHDLHVPVSIGVSIYPDDGETAEALINNADTAMYHAKENGRNNYQFFKSDMNFRAAERQSLEDGLRHALEREEFVLYYQPQVDRNRLIGALTQKSQAVAEAQRKLQLVFRGS